MEEIDISEVLNYFKSKIPILILIIFLVCMIGSVYSLFFKTPLYKSSSTIVLASGESNSTSANAQIDVTLNQKLVGTYQEIVKSRTVVESVIKRLELKKSFEELTKQITVASVNETEIIKITVLDEKPDMAQKISKTVATTFSKEVSNIYNMKNVNILDEANLPNVPYNMNLTKEFIIYFAVGFAIGVGIIFMMFYFDKSIRTIEQIENKLKLPILGAVPLYSDSRGGK